MSKELEAEVIRNIELSGRLKTRDLINTLRNRWQVRLGENYEATIKDIVRDLLKRQELVNTPSGGLKRIKVKPKGVISFAWTTDALLSGNKTVTRRNWKTSYAAQFKKDDLVYAYDKRPDFGGKPVALLRLTQTPYRQSTDKAPASGGRLME